MSQVFRLEKRRHFAAKVDLTNKAFQEHHSGSCCFNLKRLNRVLRERKVTAGGVFPH